MRRLKQCGIWALFDPDIEGAVKDSCTHMHLLFSHLPLNHEERRARGRVHDMPDPAGTSLELDFDGHVELRVVGLHVPPVLVSELLKNLVEPCLVGKKTGARGERLPTGLRWMVAVLRRFLHHPVSEPLTGIR